LIDDIAASGLEAVKQNFDTALLGSKNTLVTGGAGFLGSWLCDILVSANAAVVCVDNLSTGLMENLDQPTEPGRFTFRNDDVTKFRADGETYDLIFHFASRASPEEYQQHPVETLAANSQGLQSMLEIARKSDCTLLYASSSEVYGDAEVVPTPESYWGKVNPVGPRSCYDEGKRFGEALCMAYHRAYGLDVRIVRLFNSYGPRLRADGNYARALSRFIQQASTGSDITIYGDGRQTRSFCYVTDCTAGILLAATRPRMRGEVVNIGNPHEISILDLAEKIRKQIVSRSRIVFKPRPTDDPRRRCPEISKARRILGWSPQVSLEGGLTQTIRWFTEGRTATKRQG
jgi:UDP-glucuronate decarboxylase